MAEMYPDNEELTIFGEKVEWPGLDARGKFTNGSFDDPLVKPSFIPAETINLILDNLSELIKKTGGSPNNVSITQLADAFTSVAVAKKGVLRDEAGRAKVAAPSASDDIARKAEVDAEAKARTTGDSNTLSLAKKYVDNLLINFFTNIAVIQFPNLPSPEKVIPAPKGYRWSEVDYGGAFFRASGGAASAFNSGAQGDAIRNITGAIGEVDQKAHVPTGAFYRDEIRGNNFYNFGYGQLHGIAFDASRVVPTANENRPVNYTIIIWKLEKI
ncbi:MAG: hypothetical protein P1P64_02670 [Treponemataceae bacterium]